MVADGLPMFSKIKKLVWPDYTGVVTFLILSKLRTSTWSLISTGLLPVSGKCLSHLKNKQKPLQLQTHLETSYLKNTKFQQNAIEKG